jgi:uncharacterized protein
MLMVVAGLVVGGVVMSAAAVAQEAKDVPVKAEETAKAPEDPKAKEAARAEALRLLNAMGAEKTGRLVIGQIVDRARRSLPQIQGEFWNKFVAGIDYSEFVALQVDPYVNHLSLEDLKASADYYESPVGKRFLAARPKIAAQVMPGGRAWTMKVVTQLQTEIQNLQRAQQPTPMPAPEKAPAPTPEKPSETAPEKAPEKPAGTE